MDSGLNMSNQEKIYQILVESANSWRDQLQKTLLSSIRTPYECEQMLNGLEKNMLVFSSIQGQIQKALTIESPRILSLNKSMYDAVAEMSKSLTSNIPFDSAIKQIQKSQTEWQKSIQATVQRTPMMSDLAEALRRDYSYITKSSLYAQESILRITQATAQNLVKSSENMYDKYLEGLDQLAQSYRNFWQSIEMVPQSYFSLPHITAPTLSKEMYLAVHQVEILSPQVQISTEEISFLDEISPDRDRLCRGLRLIDPDLENMYLGALDVIRSNSRDSIRQSSVSIRELITQLLRKLSPDEEFFNWNQESSNIDNGRPTRKGRLRYIYRDRCSADCIDVVENDIAVFLEYMQALQRCTHETIPPLTKLQLKSLIIRLSHHIDAILSIAGFIC